MLPVVISPGLLNAHWVQIAESQTGDSAMSSESKAVDHARLATIAKTMVAAENKRCACGDYGTWDSTISGTSGSTPCVWASCSNCRGSAIGSPVLASDMRYWRQHGTEQMLVNQRIMAIAEREMAAGYSSAIPWNGFRKSQSGKYVVECSHANGAWYTIFVDLENNTAKSVYPN